MQSSSVKESGECVISNTFLIVSLGSLWRRGRHADAALGEAATLQGRCETNHPGAGSIWEAWEAGAHRAKGSAGVVRGTLEVKPAGQMAAIPEDGYFQSSLSKSFSVVSTVQGPFPLMTKQDFIEQRKEVARVEMVAGARPPRRIGEDAQNSWLLSAAADRYLGELNTLATSTRSQNSWKPGGVGGDV